jgi:DNA-binding GntR family transcriptional regulator
LQDVRARILDGSFLPGERIGQEALAEQYGVSRIPVRDVLRTLESEGLVTIVPHSGARVAKLDFSELIELYRMREALEPEILAESVQRLTDADLAEVRRRLEALEAELPDSKQFLADDRLFHLATYRAAPMPRALGLIQTFWDQTQQYRRAYLSSLPPASFGVIQLEHRLLLEAIERRDPVDAAERQRSHIRRTRRGLSERAELFDVPPGQAQRDAGTPAPASEAGA